MTEMTELSAVLRGLEEELLRREVRQDRGRIEKILVPEFREFGSSGRVYGDREAIIKALANESAAERRLAEFRAELLGTETVLVTYRSFQEGRDGAVIESLRSSVWAWRDERWQMVFHQGTRVEVAG